MDFFKGVGNFFGGLFGGNKDDEERKRQQQQQAQRQAQQQAQQNQQRSQPQTGFTPSAPTLQPFTPQNNIPNRQNQSNDALNSLIFNKPQQPKPQPAPESITNKISGYHVMSPATQRQAVIDSPEARLDKLNKNIEQRKRNQEGIKKFTSTLGSIPVVNTGANASTWLTSLAGNLTGNKDWQERADNTRNMINIGMTDQELRRLPDAQEGKLRNVSNVASGLSLLDVAGVASVAKAPIIGGAKEAVKKGLTSEAGKSILKETAKETGKQYGKHIAIGAGVGGVADPALQAYINDGKVDWSSVPSSMLQSGLWAAAIPEFAGKSRLTNKMRAGGSLVHEVEPNAPAIRENSPITPAGENPAQKPSGISSPNRPAGANKAQNFPTKTEPQPAVTQPVPRPEPQPVQPRPEPAYQTPPQTLQDAIGEPNAQLAPPRPVEPVTAPESPLQPIQRQLDEQMLEPPRPEVVTPPRVVETPAQVQARQVQELNATQPRLTPEQVADINAQKALNDAPTEAMMAEARKYKSAEEFVKAQGEPLYHGTRDAKMTKFDPEYDYEMHNSNDAVGQIRDYETPYGRVFLTNDINEGKAYGQNMLETYFKNKPKVKTIKTGDVPPSQYFDNEYNYGKLADIVENEPFDAIRLVDNNGKSTTLTFPELLRTKQELTDLYNQAHTSQAPKAEATPSAVDVSEGGKAMSVEDELASRLSRRLIPGISPSREYNNAIRDAFQELPDDYQRWVENFSHRMRSTSEREEAVLHPERYQDLFEQETRRTPSLTPVKPELATPKQEVPAQPKPRTFDDIADEANALDENDPANAKRLQQLHDEFDKLDEVQTAPAPKAAPKSDISYTPPRKNGKASVPGTQSVHYNTGDANLDGIIHDSIIAHKGTASTAEVRANALDNAGVDSTMRGKIRNIATRNVDKQTGRISDSGIEAIRKVLRGEADQPALKAVKTSEPVTEPTNVVQAPQPTKTSTPPSDGGELGKVARQAVLDGSITTKEGQAEVIRKTTALANKEAKQAGTTIEDIIRKGQETWEKSKQAKHDLSPEEVANGAKTPEGKAISPVDGFTPEQQSIYKRYSQELSTVRDRTEVALKEGNQGEWYAPRQYLDDMGNSPKYNPDLINEMKRNTTAKTNSEGNPLDYSTRQHEDYLRRYMDAENAGTQRLVNAVEKNADTGEATGVKLSDKAKTNVSEGMEKVIAKRDEGLKLQAEGDAKGAMKAQREVQREIDRTFKQLIRDVPAGPGRKEAVNQLKVLRGTYMQSTVQTFALSNIVNRVADQGARVLLGAQRPVTRLLEKAIAPMMDKKVMEGVEALTLNTSKNARKAAKEMTKGTLGNEIRDNFKANTALAGEGRNALAKTVAKIDAYVRASGTSVTQSGDISTQVARRALELGASRPEAKGLKTVDEYKRYFADYMNGKNFKADLASAEADLMPRIGLAGSEGDNMAHGGKFSKGVSKYLDNGVKTGVEALGQRFGVKGLGDKRIVQEVNDYWKVNGPGYAAVTSRVFGYVSNSLAGGVPKVLKAVKEAGKGDPAASARATQIAAQSISDAVAVYGTIGAAFILPKIAEGAIGFTGAQPTSGSSDSAHNKSEQVPANQWYLNIPGGDRLYIDPSRIGAPGVGANLAGGLQKGTAGDTAANTLGQMANQVGGESLPEKYNTFTTAFADTTASESEREYARKRLGSMAAPAMGLSNNIANWMDDKKRDTAGFTNTLKSRIPGLRQSVPVATDARGNEIANTKQVSGGSSLLSIGKNTESKEYKASDPVGAEIARLQKGDQDVFPTNANENAKNKNTQDLASMLINDDVYKKADDKKKGEMMSSVLNGTDFKDVNTSISSDDKLAIMHAKQQGDKKDKWLESNDNAANYYRADYNNAKANNTLTDKDENLNEKAGKKYKMISAQVDKDFGADQELKRLYSAIDSSEIKKYFNLDSDMYDPELGERLLAFDQVRTDKGVSRNSNFSDRPKYNAVKARGGSSGRGGSRSGSGGKAKGYNLPTSLLSGKSNSAPAIKRGERLFKTPTLVSTAEKTKSRIPNISVKKGIHL